MPDRKNRYANNAPGRYYVDSECIFCNLCADLAPANFDIDDEGGHDYVKRQPLNAVEEEQCQEALRSCPVEAIGCDGDES